ncbi:MAG: alpha/beta hydrolase [Casimicrobiaceae bacterium]
MPYVTIERDHAPALSLHYEIWGDRPAAPTIVLVHELGGSLESFRAFGAILALRHRVVAFDQRGAGRSEKPTGPCTIADLADDIRALADAIKVAAPFHLLGLAMGAITALRFAVQHGERLDSLILCDAISEINDGSRNYLLRQAESVRKEGMRAVADATFKNAFRGLADAAANPAWAAYRQAFLGNAPEAYAMQLTALAGMSLTAEDMGKVRCRTLALTGKHDAIWPPAAGEALTAKLPNARFEILENAAHLPPVQDTKSVAACVMDFLEEEAHSRFWQQPVPIPPS